MLLPFTLKVKFGIPTEFKERCSCLISNRRRHRFMNIKEPNKIPILSFYSGGGFLDMGFEKAGFEVVWTNENDPVFAELHAAGITSWRKARGNGIKAEIFNTK